MPTKQAPRAAVVSLLKKAAAAARKHAGITRERSALMRAVAEAFTRQADDEPDGHRSGTMRKHADAARLQAHALEREGDTAEMEAEQYESRADVEAAVTSATTEARRARAALAPRSAGRPRRRARSRARQAR